MNKENAYMLIKDTKRTRLTLYEENKRLASEWYPTKNARLTPKDITCGSDKKVWWLCSKGHEWEDSVSHRTSGRGCPYCAGKKVGKDNCLQTVNPGLAGEWYPSKNSPLTPKDVVPGSSKKVWWKCKKGHVWKTKISHRSGGSGCPYCTGKKVSVDNCLQTVNPKLAEEWHPTKNVPLTPNDVTRAANRKVWWQCSKGHEWEATVATRSRGMGCPYCTGKKACKDNCLQTVNPILAREWHPTKNIPLTPEDVTKGSNKKVWWRCRYKNHEWEAVIISRSKGRGCPYCAGKKASEDNCLQTINPMLAKQWHITKNAPLTSKDVVPGSHKKVWWVCHKGHEWPEAVVDRFRGSGCPYCYRENIYKHSVTDISFPSTLK